MPRQWPLEIEVSREFDCDTKLECFSQGHHDAQTFLDAADSEECLYDYFAPIPLSMVRHEYWRKVPYTIEGRRGWQFVPAQGPGRGAFPVTTIFLPDLSELRRQRKSEQND